MTPNARDLAKSIAFAKSGCGKLALNILDALDDAEFGSSRILQENPQCTADDINGISDLVLRASNAVETASILLEFALQRLKEKTSS